MGRAIRRVALATCIFSALVVAVAAQQTQTRGTANSSTRPNVAPSTAPKAAPAAEPTQEKSVQGNVDEKFELNISERRITEHDFFASTAIEAGEGSARGLSLRVGVALGASEIDVLLRNVRGSVRFRGSLDVLQRILDARRPASAPPPASVP